MVGNGSLSTGRRSFLKALGVTGLLGTATATASAAPDRKRQRGSKPDELLIGTAPAASLTETVATVTQALPVGAEVVHRNRALGYMAVRLPDVPTAASKRSMKTTLQARPGVDYVEDNATFHAIGTPNDSYFGSQYAPQQVEAPEAWNTTLGSSGVTIAVVDEGVQYDHPDLAAQFGSDPGYDFVDRDSDPYPDSLSDEYHGTHVAGIASGTTGNGTGIAGMSNSTLLSGRALSEEGSGSTSDIADAIQWSADQGADLVNLSLGGGGYTQTMKNAVSYALDNGTLPIVAAGNDGANKVSYPARYSECVAVSAVDEDQAFASFSNAGPNVDVAAPGVDVLSTVPDDQYGYLSGTSMACPATTGVAALGLAARPGLSARQLRRRLKNTAVDIGLPSDQQGSGRVDAANIVG